MNSLLSWSRTLTFALLCMLTLAPGALHARICLVSLGVIEKSDCCSVGSCCSEDESDGPALKAVEHNCHCCLDLELESNDKTPLARAPANDPQVFVAPTYLSAVLPAPTPPLGLERARKVFARAGPRPGLAAPLPLRI